MAGTEPNFTEECSVSLVNFAALPAILLSTCYLVHSICRTNRLIVLYGHSAVVVCVGRGTW